MGLSLVLIMTTIVGIGGWLWWRYSRKP
jgi:hypothetical protein